MDKEIIFNRLTSDEITNKVFENSVNFIIDYMTKNNLKSMVLGLSGGIDSTVAASICYEVSKRSGIKLIGRSLPIKNKTDEISISNQCMFFCQDFNEKALNELYGMFLKTLYDSHEIELEDKTNPIANGNIQARLRMIYLYYVAQINQIIVIYTDNKY